MMALSLLFSMLLLTCFCVQMVAAWTSPSARAHIARRRHLNTPSSLQMGLVGGFSSTARRVRDSLLSRERSESDLKIGIAGFYDRSSKLWEDVWGEVSLNTLRGFDDGGDEAWKRL